MTKPLTWLCLFLALGSGLFLYQTKHRAQLLDREIAQVMRVADAARARSGVLQAEYQLLSDPQRLASLTTSHLSLRPTAPGQFSTWADLERRLPPVGLPPADPSPATLLAAMDGSPETEFASTDDLPVPPIPPSIMPVAMAQAAPAPTPVARPAPPAAAAPVMVATRPAPVPPRIAPARMATLPNPVVNAVISSVMASAPRRVVLATTGTPAYRAPAYAAAYAAPSSYAAPPAQSVGSSLGMARFRLPSPLGTANAASFSTGGGAQ